MTVPYYSTYLHSLYDSLLATCYPLPTTRTYYLPPTWQDLDSEEAHQALERYRSARGKGGALYPATCGAAKAARGQGQGQGKGKPAKGKGRAQGEGAKGEGKAARLLSWEEMRAAGVVAAGEAVLTVVVG